MYCYHDYIGHADVAELLLQHNANKDCRTKTGITPLFQVSCITLTVSHHHCCMCRHVGRIM